MQTNSDNQWIVCQIGAREHYSVARALAQAGRLAQLYTDAYWKYDFPGQRHIVPQKLLDRQHPSIPNSLITHFLPHFCMQRHRSQKLISAWDRVMADNELFAECVSTRITKVQAPCNHITIFAYSYAAEKIFRIAKRRGWKTVLGQIDPGPEEERIVQAEHQRFPEFRSTWQPAPRKYWEQWRRETDLADWIVVNSEWSQECLLREGIPSEKIVIIPLCYDFSRPKDGNQAGDYKPSNSMDSAIKVLFLGQVNLRKGIARLVKAMELLSDLPEIHLQITGPCEIDLDYFRKLPNIHYTPSVPRSEVGRQYSNADLFILPTLSDGYALTQLEALAYGLPLMKSRYCGKVAGSESENVFILSDLEPQTIANSLREFSRNKPKYDANPPKNINCIRNLNQLLVDLMSLQGRSSV